MSVVYKIPKRICGNNINQSALVKDKNGNALTTERNQAARWVQHFQEVLNIPEPDGLGNPPAPHELCEINLGIPRKKFLGIKGLNFHGKFRPGKPRNSQVQHL